MLALVLMYWIGKYFYKLAEEYNKSPWGFAILGIVVYYGAIVLSGLIVGIVMALTSPETLDNFNETLLSFLLLPFGILSCYLLYKYLEKTWKKNTPDPVELIDEIGKPNEIS